MIRHGIDPVYDDDSRVLILGSFPSVKSREAGFFYGHPQNRFWKVMSALTGSGLPATVAEKKALLLKNGIALYDVIAECEITGSSDSSIVNAVPNDLRPILETADIRAIFCNGRTAYALYNRYMLPALGRECVYLPSTSPANAAYSLERLISIWRNAIAFQEDRK